MVQLDKDYFLKAGVHFGHPTSRWNPNFKPFIAMKKNGIHIIDLDATIKCLKAVGDEITKIVQGGGNILFVGTKKQAKDVVQQEADRCSMYYVVERWLGGTLTNFATIKRSIKRLTLLEKEASEIYDNLTKKEINMLERERVKLGDLHRGIKDMKHLPAALFFVDGNHEKIAINEAYTLGIPVFGMVDSNTDPTDITFPVPSNDDSIRSIKAIVGYVADKIIEARGGLTNSDEESMNDDKIEENSNISKEENPDDISLNETNNDNDKDVKMETDVLVESETNPIKEKLEVDEE